jgi:hypothetical protein
MMNTFRGLLCAVAHKDDVRGSPGAVLAYVAGVLWMSLVPRLDPAAGRREPALATGQVRSLAERRNSQYRRYVDVVYPRSSSSSSKLTRAGWTRSSSTRQRVAFEQSCGKCVSFHRY